MVASAGDINTSIEACLDRTAYLRALAPNVYSPKNFGGIGNGSADDTAAIQNAINAAAVAGGTVRFPAGTWLHTGLTVPEGVDLVFEQRAFLSINHATNDSITFTGAPTYTPNLVIGARFVAYITNTGSVVRAAAGARVRLHGCTFNSPADIALQGRFGRADAAGARLRFENCRCDVSGSLRAYEASNGGQIEVEGGRLKMPATYNTQLAYVNNGSRIDLEGVDIDLTAHASGTPTILLADSASSASMIGCRIDATGSAGTATGFAWSTAARVTAVGNEWRGSLTVYGPALAAAGSDLELLPYITGSNASNAYTVASGYRSVAVHNLAGASAPAFTLPAKYFAGQKFTLTLYNNTGGNWASTTIAGGLPTGYAGVLNGAVKVLHFEVVDYDANGTYEWMCTSERG